MPVHDLQNFAVARDPTTGALTLSYKVVAPDGTVLFDRTGANSVPLLARLRALSPDKLAQFVQQAIPHLIRIDHDL